MAIAPFPHEYRASLAGDQLSAPALPSVSVGAPPEFGGRADVWSPEHLLLGATLACLKTTFDAYAARAQLRILAWRGTATGTLDKAPGTPVFTSIRLAVELQTAAGDGARAKQLLETAEKHCIISRALAVPVELAISIVEAPAEQTAQAVH